MKLCDCGCGSEVKSLSARFIRGHQNRSIDVKNKKKQIEKCMVGVFHK